MTEGQHRADSSMRTSPALLRNVVVVGAAAGGLVLAALAGWPLSGAKAAADPPLGRLVACIDGEDVVGQVWADGALAVARDVSSPFRRKLPPCRSFDLPPGQWVVGIDLPPRKGCEQPVLTRIVVRRDGIEHTSQSLLAFTITGIAPTLTTMVTFTAACPPPAQPARPQSPASSRTH